MSATALVVPAHAGLSPTPAGFAPACPLPIVDPAPALPVPAATAAPVGVVLDVADLAKRQMRRHERGHKRRGGGERSPTTTGNYETNLRFIVEHLRYQPGYSALEALGNSSRVPRCCLSATRRPASPRRT